MMARIYLGMAFISFGLAGALMIYQKKYDMAMHVSFCSLIYGIIQIIAGAFENDG